MPRLWNDLDARNTMGHPLGIQQQVPSSDHSTPPLWKVEMGGCSSGGSDPQAHPIKPLHQFIHRLFSRHPLLGYACPLREVGECRPRIFPQPPLKPVNLCPGTSPTQPILRTKPNKRRIQHHPPPELHPAKCCLHHQECPIRPSHNEVGADCIQDSRGCRPNKGCHAGKKPSDLSGDFPGVNSPPDYADSVHWI